MNILIIESKADVAAKIEALLESRFHGSNIFLIPTVPEAFELLDQRKQRFDFLICCYSGKSPSMLAGLLDAAPESLALICFDPSSSLKGKFEHRNVVATIQSKDIPLLLSTTLDNLIASDAFKYFLSADGDFFGLKPEILCDQDQLLADVYLRLGDNRYVKLLSAGDRFTDEDLVRFRDHKKIETFFVKRTECDKLIELKRDQLASLVDDPSIPPELAAKVAEGGLEVLQSMVKQVGFTPAVQELATNSVKVALTIMGKSPTFSNILAHLKKGQGKYITAHSLTLGQLACGLSNMVGWTSTSTYFKLTMAAFMHDIAILDNDAARFTTLKEAERLGKYQDEEIKVIKFHPLKAAEFIKNFSSIPPDVDVIVAQHHEQPDGSGFPRGLAANYISPLSALFIISHDLLNYFMEKGKNADVQEFLMKREEHYNRGSFRKVFKALQEQQPIDE